MDRWHDGSHRMVETGFTFITTAIDSASQNIFAITLHLMSTFARSAKTYVRKQLRKRRTTGYEKCQTGAEAIIWRSYDSVERILVDVEKSCAHLPINGAQY